MATQYIEHPDTKERIPFEWNKSTPPTSQDIDALFKAVSGGKQNEPTTIKRSVGKRIAGTVAPYARPVLEFGGAMAGGALAAPGNIVAPGVSEVLGVAGGYAVGRGASNLIEEYAGTRKTPSPINVLAETGKDVRSGLEMGMMGPIGGKILSKGSEIAGKVVKPVLGRLTGAGTGSIEEAVASGSKTGLKDNPFKSTTDFDKAMRGKITGEEVVDNAKTALSTLKDQRATAYQTHLAQVTQDNQPINLTPIGQKVTGLMRQYGIQIKPNGKLDFSRVAMGKTGRKDIEEITKTLRSWGSHPGDDTAIGLDTLKRQLDDFYSDSSQARAFVTSLRNTVKDTITKSVPEYAEMTKGYAEATNLIKDIESGLMLRKTGMSGRIVADQTLRRLMSSMRDNFPLRRELVNVLGSKGGQDLSGQIAGYTMRSVVPLGIAGTGPALVGEAAIAKFIDPRFWPVLAASSPRVTGEFLRMYGKALAEMPGMSQALGKLGAYGALRKESTPSTGTPSETGQ